MKTPFTLELALQYGFVKQESQDYSLNIPRRGYLLYCINDGCLYLDIIECEIPIQIPCYLENIKALYFALTNDILKKEA